MLRSLYDRTIALSASPHALWWVAIVSFAESSFFPIPPDVMLIPLLLARPATAWRYAAVCTIASVAGGVLGYWIGYAVFDQLAQPIIAFYGYSQKFAAFQALYQEYGLWLILAKGLTPIPYKIVTIASGLAGVPFASFMAYSAITRSLRFVVLEGVLVHFFGEKAQALLEKYLELALILFVVALVLGFVALKYL